MKIGVFLTKENHKKVGLHYSRELLNSLVNLINLKNLTWIFFLVSNDYDGKYLVFKKNKKIKHKIIYENILLKKIFIFLSHLLDN